MLMLLAASGYMDLAIPLKLTRSRPKPWSGIRHTKNTSQTKESWQIKTLPNFLGGWQKVGIQSKDEVPIEACGNQLKVVFDSHLTDTRVRTRRRNLSELKSVAISI